MGKPISFGHSGDVVIEGRPFSSESPPQVVLSKFDLLGLEPHIDWLAGKDLVTYQVEVNLPSSPAVFPNSFAALGRAETRADELGQFVRDLQFVRDKAKEAARITSVESPFELTIGQCRLQYYVQATMAHYAIDMVAKPPDELLADHSRLSWPYVGEFRFVFVIANLSAVIDALTKLNHDVAAFLGNIDDRRASRRHGRRKR